MHTRGLGRWHHCHHLIFPDKEIANSRYCVHHYDLTLSITKIMGIYEVRTHNIQNKSLPVELTSLYINIIAFESWDVFAFITHLSMCHTVCNVVLILHMFKMFAKTRWYLRRTHITVNCYMDIYLHVIIQSMIL